MAINLFSGGNYVNSLTAAGKNKIINGDFGVWQRGTSFNTASTGWNYTADRWMGYTFSASTLTISQQTFTPGTAPVSGYEGTYFLRTTSTNTSNQIGQRIEDVRTFAGQTVTLSFWAKSASAQTLTVLQLSQKFGTGGSADVDTNLTLPTLTTSWARYTATVAVPSVSGKTIGAGSNLQLTIAGAINNALDIWGVQLELGTTATTFTTASGGSPQGELAMCQRYYQNTGANPLWSGNVTTGLTYYMTCQLPVIMRISPTCTYTITNNNGFPATNPSGSTITPGTIWATAVANTTGGAAFFGFTYTANAEL